MYMIYSYTQSDVCSKLICTSMWYTHTYSQTPREWLTLCIAVTLTTVTSVLLSVYALFRLDMGVQQTLTSLAPIYAVPLAWLMQVVLCVCVCVCIYVCI